jgi:hypothetical protein
VLNEYHKERFELLRVRAIGTAQPSTGRLKHHAPRRAPHRARVLGVSLLSGDYGQDKLERADTYRVYQDPADILRRLEKVGARSRIDCLR